MKDKTSIQEECLERIIPLKRCGAAISMGVGKTLLGLKHMNKMYESGARKFLVVAPKRSIFKSWTEDAAKFEMEHLIPCIKFCTYIGLPKQKTEYDVIYLDECHSLLYSHQGYLDTHNGGILGLTGTAPKWAGSEKGIMVDTYCPIAYEYITDDAVDDGILNDYRIIVHRLPLDSANNYLKKTKQGGQWMTSELNDYQFWGKRIDASTS